MENSGNKKNFKKILIFLFCFFLVAGVFLFAAKTTWAQPEFGEEYAEETQLGDTDPRIILARGVQLALTFLAIIAVIIIMYAGFLWMTSNGREERIEKAKNTLKNAIIGLVIILSALVIVSFVLNEIGGMFRGGGGGTGGTAGPPAGGFGAIGSCSVESVYPEPNQKDVPRNTSIIVTFKEEVDPSTVIDGGRIVTSSVEIYKKDDEINKLTNVAATTTSDHKTFVFTPGEYLGSPSEEVWYTVNLTNEILNTEGRGIFDHCYNEYLKWPFQVSTELDLTPPQVESIFPAPDDSRDSYTITASLQQATGAVTFNNTPDVYEKATGTISVSEGPNVQELNMDPNSSQEGALEIAVEPDGLTAVIKNNDTGINLGSAQFQGNVVEFSGILSLELEESPGAGNSWEVEAEAVQQADTLTVANQIYTFVNSAVLGNEIEVGNYLDNTASTIHNNDNGLSASVSGDTINLTAEAGGESGNNITLSTNDSDGDIDITPMSGGQDEETTVTVNDSKDEYRNATIQINFTEAVNPINLSGQATDASVNQVIRIVNASSSALTDGSTCSEDRQCRSLNCNQGNCSPGEYLEGKFMISNKYRTVEFISNNICGVNSCGQQIYCLPSNANLKVEFLAAELADCGTQNCSNRSPYNTCSGGVCQDSEGNNYPMASGFDGVVDMALNSLDGDKDGNAEGRGEFFDQNGGGTPILPWDLFSLDTGENLADSYTWSFWLNDEIKLGAPVIQNMEPGNLNFTNTPTTSDFKKPVKIEFDTLMQSGSLRTGGTQMQTQDGLINHRQLNIWNYTGEPTGYWISKENIEDEPPFDAQPNRTDVFINHSQFSPALTYRAQAGSGLLDIYQNCFKPSGTETGDCGGVTEAEPSCCNGTVTDDVDAQGNCQ